MATGPSVLFFFAGTQRGTSAIHFYQDDDTNLTGSVYDAILVC